MHENTLDAHTGMIREQKKRIKQLEDRVERLRSVIYLHKEFWRLKKIKQLEDALKDAALGHFPLKTFSSRPCGTCDIISELIGRPFGCTKIAQKALNK